MAELTRAAPAVAEVRPRPLRLDRLAGRIALYAVLIILSFSFLLPLLWMISTSLKDTPQTYHVPPIWIPWPMRFQNYPEALTQQPFGLFFINSFRFGLLSAIGAVLSCSIVAYGFSRIRWW